MYFLSTRICKQKNDQRNPNILLLLESGECTKVLLRALILTSMTTNHQVSSRKGRHALHEGSFFSTSLVFNILCSRLAVQ